MSLQLIEAYIPKKHFEKVEEKLQSFSLISYWRGDQSADRYLVRLLVKTEQSEEILNYLEHAAHLVEGFEIMMLPVSTYFRRETEEDQKKRKQEESEKKMRIERASRHELFMQMASQSKLSWTYIIFVVLSAIVVTIGLIKNSSAIVIGGMVIAPLLGPVISLAFASILGDFRLVRRALITVLFGIILALIISIPFGVFIDIPFESREFMSRTEVDMMDVVLALASGAAGALSILKRFPSALVGVMVAVALLPPTIVLGMTLGSFMWDEAFHAFLLLAINVNAVLLSAVTLFSLTGIRPVKYEEIQRANNSKKFAFIFISIMVIILLSAILYSNRV
ncbi:TIGR00341 family protein [Bacillus sp. FJAT-47783]|uniref:TIGR00341 family protein n=1 Tax=Bacillus sp. FJAT-47783 TaxID=2922712 RepID=UPI001FAE0028|nr:TIGR00341 family protein [Bacillus sp. FJAT-47783]